MSFGISCRNFNHIQSYADAAKAWNKAVVFSKHDSTLAPRGLVDKRKKHLAIERTAADDFILRLYNHPVVTWHKDGALTLDLYSSVSTSRFANHCTPPGMYVSCGNYKNSSVSSDKLWYRANKPLTFRLRDGKWKIADRSQIEPWSVRSVNRARAKQAYAETHYDEFRLWFQVYIQMTTKPEGQSGWIDKTNIVRMLRERKWRDLLASRFLNAWSHPDTVLREIRDAIHEECKCIDYKSVPFLER